MGFHSFLQQQNVPFESALAKSWNMRLFKHLRRRVEHSQLKIPAASKDVSLPIAFQGIGDSWRKKKSAFVATQTTSRKAPAVTANMMSDQK